MAESRGKNKNLVEAGNPRLLKKLVKNDTEYSLYLEYHHCSGEREIRLVHIAHI